MRRRDASTSSVERGGTAKAATAASPAMLDMRDWGVEAIFVMIIPIGSMYAIYGNIYHQYTPNVSIYTIHGSYGNDQCWMRFFWYFSELCPLTREDESFHEDLGVSHGGSWVVPMGFQGAPSSYVCDLYGIFNGSAPSCSPKSHLAWPKDGEIYGHLGSPDLDRCWDLHISCRVAVNIIYRYIYMYNIYIYMLCHIQIIQIVSFLGSRV